jgi:formylglycine-generating enzyme required for sulfatase activity
MDKNIFISYRRGDSEGVATLLFDRLQNHFSEMRIFMDVSDFYAGGDYKAVVDTTINLCKVMLLVIGPEWELAKDEMGRNRLDDSHDFVRVEVQAALNHGILIVPLLVNRDKMPKQDVLPFTMRDLMKYDPHVIHTRRLDASFYRLLTTLDGYLGNVEVSTIRSTRVDKTGLTIINCSILSGLTIILVLFIFFWLQSNGEKDNDIPLLSENVGGTDTGAVDATGIVASNTLTNKEVVLPTQTQTYLSTETINLINTLTPSPTSTPTFELLAPQVIDPVGVSMVLIPQGPFIMGTNDIEPWNLVSRPAATIGLDVFYIDKYEVSNGLYAECVHENVCNPPSKDQSKTRQSYYGNPAYVDYPVIYISWNDASTFCAWRGGRLPLEAEWEKAARGEEANTYPWGGESAGCQYANFTPDNACEGDTLSVRSFSLGASPYGVFNMSGNVYEWVQDWFQPYPGGNPDATKKFGQSYRVVRGGAYFDGFINIRTTSRFGANPEYGFSYVGFRCVFDIDALP